jgi:hypothetical protein
MVWPQIWLRDCRHNVPTSSDAQGVDGVIPEPAADGIRAASQVLNID